MTQGFIVGRLISFGYSDRFLMKAPVAILSLSFAALGLFVMDWRSFCIIAILMTLAWSIFTLVLLAKLTTTVQKNDTGKYRLLRCSTCQLRNEININLFSFSKLHNTYY